jgi:hypothetical protein
MVNSSPITWWWGAATDLGLGVEKYVVEVGTTPGASDLRAATEVFGLSYTLSPVADGVVAHLRVQAVDLAGQAGPFSNVANGTLVDLVGPGPVNFTFGPPQFTNSSVLAWTWIAAVDLGSGTAMYEIELYEAGQSNPVATQPTSDLSFSFDVGSGGSTYYLAVSAVDVAGNSGIVVQSERTTVDLEPPPAVSFEVTIERLINTRNLTWKWTSAPDAGSVVKGYTVLLGTTPGGADVASLLVVDPTFQFTGFTSGAMYYLSVRAVDMANNSGPVAAAPPIHVDLDPPVAPAVEASAPWVIERTVTISWAPAEDLPSIGGTGVAEYAVRVESEGVLVSAFSTQNTTTTVTVAPNRDYLVSIAAVDAAGNVGPAASVIFGTDFAGPTAPGELRVSVSDPQRPAFVATWEEASDSASGVARYWIMVGSSPGESDIVPQTLVNGTRFVWNASFDQPNHVTVWAEDAAGNDGERVGTSAPAVAQAPFNAEGLFLLVLAAGGGGAAGLYAWRRKRQRPGA